MRRELRIEPTKTTPEVNFDVGERVLLLKGRSLPSEPDSFYKQIDDFIGENTKEGPITLDLELDYFNTPSHKRILMVLSNLSKESPDSKVIWKYYDDDEEMLDVGKNMEYITKAQFEFVMLSE